MHIHENSIMTLLQPLIVCHSPFKFFYAIQFKWLSHPILGFCFFRRKRLVSNKLEAFYRFCYQSSYHLQSWHKSCRLRQLTLSGCVIHLLDNMCPLNFSLITPSLYLSCLFTLFCYLLLSCSLILIYLNSHINICSTSSNYENLFLIPIEINRKLSLPEN